MQQEGFCKPDKAAGDVRSPTEGREKVLSQLSQRLPTFRMSVIAVERTRGRGMKECRYCKACQKEVAITHSSPCPHCGSTSGFLVTIDRQATISAQEWDARFAISVAQQLPRQMLRTIGRCIYCFAAAPPLQTEHIVPFGLGGRWELAEASCPRCAAITGRFEQHLLREILNGPRAALNLRTRRPKGRPRTYPFSYIKDGRVETVSLTAREYPALAVFPCFAPPACLDKRAYTKGIDVAEPVLVQLGGPNIKATLQRYGAKTVRYSVRHDFDFYPRCILKIAYGFAVATLGLEGISEATILPAIVGQRDDSGMWLGCDGVRKLPGSSLHEYSVAVDNQIIVRIGLFSPVKSVPEYVAVIGKPKIS